MQTNVNSSYLNVSCLFQATPFKAEGTQGASPNLQPAEAEGRNGGVASSTQQKNKQVRTDNLVSIHFYLRV